MGTKRDWKASLTEYRAAWIVACLCLLVIAIAGVRPDFFEGSIKKVDEVAVHDTAPIKKSTLPTPKRAETPVTTAKPVPEKRAVVKKVKEKPAAPAPGYYIQLGAFNEASRAQGLLDRLKKHHSATITRKSDGLLAVWVGPKKSRAEAEKLQKAIKSELKTESFIILQKRK